MTCVPVVQMSAGFVWRAVCVLALFLCVYRSDAEPVNGQFWAIIDIVGSVYIRVLQAFTSVTGRAAVADL